jgi:hypothetical protein
MNSYEFNNHNPDFLSSNGFKNYNNMLSSQEIIFYYENSRFLWKELMKINTTYIFKSKDISLIEPYTENILYSRLNPDDIDLLSTEYIVQLVTLLQLIGQYLVYTQKRLEQENQELKDKIEEIGDNSKNNEKYKILIENLNRQNQEKDFLIKTYQTMGYSMSNRNNNKLRLDNENNFKGKNDRYSENESKIYICKICSGKKFKSKKYLDDHMQRRHFDVMETDTERQNNGDNIREEFDRKLNSMTEYLTKMVKENLENNELYLLNKKIDNLQNELFTRNDQFIQNNNQIRNVNQVNPANATIGKNEKLKNYSNDVKNLRDEFHKGMAEMTNLLNNEKKKLKDGESNDLSEVNYKKRMNTKYKTDIQIANNKNIKEKNEKEKEKEKTISNVNVNITKEEIIIKNEKNTIINDNNQKREDYKEEEKEKKEEKENKNINDENIFDKNKNKNIILNKENENKTKTEFSNTNETIKNTKDEDKKIDIINVSTHNEEEINKNEQNKLKDNNPNNMDNKIKREEEENEKVENGDIYEKEESKNQSANFCIKDSVNELKDSKTKKSKPKEEIIEFKEKMDKRDNEFYNKENEDYEIIEIPSEFNANNKEINNKIENELEENELNKLINNFENNCKNENIKGKDIYKILEIDNILKDFKEYMEEKNVNQKDITNNDNKEDDKKRVYNIKTSDVFSSQIQKNISVEKNNPYNKDANNNKDNLLESSLQLLEHNMEQENEERNTKKKSINQNVIIGHKIT